MAKAFLSHSSQDKTLIKKVAKQLGNKNCVLDEISFDPGRKTLQEIFTELDSSDIFVIFLSEHSIKSTWVKKELKRAKENLDRESIERIFPIIIDENIKYSDERIPKWIAKPYNLKLITNEVIILNKIRQSLKEVSFKKTRFNKEIEKNFVGRNTEMQKFENAINNLDNWTPTCIIAYNYFEGIGRRTFIKNALRKHSIIDYLDTPTTITIDAKESLENFIYKLNTVEKNPEIFEYDFSSIDQDSKVEIAIKLVKQFMDFKELIFVIDDGGIILPNGKITEWFTSIINDDAFNNNLVICLISKFRPNEIFLRKQHKSLTFRIPELSQAETKNLFLKLLKIYEIDNIRREEKEYILDHLKGIPSQIIYAVNLLEINPLEARKNIGEIVSYSDRFSSTILNHLKEDETTYQLVLLLSMNELFSIDLLNKVFEDDEKISNALQKLFDLSLFNFVFGGYEYIKLNPTLSDFISRSKLKLDNRFGHQLNVVTKNLLQEDLDKIISEDYSEFMITLQRMLEENIKIPKKYFIPSLLIKNVIKEYDKGNYEYVIKICIELLENQNYDEQIIWETNYRLTLAYARTRNNKFFDHISYFQNESNKLDYFFLLGFYHRNNGNKPKALDYYYKALEVYPGHARSKREIVNLYLAMGKYDDALELAKENYENRKTNIYHTHSYFVCLIRSKTSFTEREKQLLETLKDSVKNNPNIKAEDIYRCMEGEFVYYVNNNFKNANELLLEAIQISRNKSYPKKSLSEIYRLEGLENLSEEIDSIEEDNEE